jgi:hypothetical protein
MPPTLTHVIFFIILEKPKKNAICNNLYNRLVKINGNIHSRDRVGFMGRRRNDCPPLLGFFLQIYLIFLYIIVNIEEVINRFANEKKKRNVKLLL